MVSKFWQDNHDLVKREIERGTPYSAIGSMIGVSRNAAIGYAKRAGLAKRLPIQRRPKPRIAGKPVAAEAFVSLDPAWRRDAFRPRHDRHLSFAKMDFTAKCKWPLDGPDGQILFCAEAKTADAIVRGRPYCQEHAAMAHVSRT